MISEEALEVWLSLALDTGDGPWDWDSRGKGFEVTDSKGLLVAQCESRTEAMFIAEARTAIPALIASVRELQHRLDQAYSHARDCCAEVGKVEKEADWLAKYLTKTKIFHPADSAMDCHKLEGPAPEISCITCWRQAARKATESE